MIVRVLGSAAGGGLPQWNCACANCGAARAGRIARRSESSFAVSGDGASWWLINTSSDIGKQIEAFAPLQPRATRGTPIAGMLFTDANVDHLGGLAVLRQSGDHGFRIYSSALVRELATAQPAFSPFSRAPHAWHAADLGKAFDLDRRLRATLVDVDGTTPGYAGRRRGAGAVVAVAIEDRETGGTLLAAPVFAAVDEALLKSIAGTGAAFVDGSFFTDDELRALDVAGKASRRLGHLPVAGADGSLAALGPHAATTRLIFAHVNNTNPLCDPASAASREVAARGFEVAYDGMQFEL